MAAATCNAFPKPWGNLSPTSNNGLCVAEATDPRVFRSECKWLSSECRFHVTKSRLNFDLPTDLQKPGATHTANPVPSLAKIERRKCVSSPGATMSKLPALPIGNDGDRRQNDCEAADLFGTPDADSSRSEPHRGSGYLYAHGEGEPAGDADGQMGAASRWQRKRLAAARGAGPGGARTTYYGQATATIEAQGVAPNHPTRAYLGACSGG